MAVGLVSLGVWIAAVFWAVWRLCRKLGWPGWYAFSMFIPFVGFIFFLLILATAFQKAGYNRWLFLLGAIPVLNLFVAIALALSRWPGESESPPASSQA
jgi:hypothetical protein